MVGKFGREDRAATLVATQQGVGDLLMQIQPPR
jgi:hypothetical protein